MYKKILLGIGLMSCLGISVCLVPSYANADQKPSTEKNAAPAEATKQVATIKTAAAGDGSVKLGDGSVRKAGDGSVKPGDGTVKLGDGSVKVAKGNAGR